MIPCCFHPTRIIILNDSKELLDSLNQQLSRSHMTLDFFENSDKALHYINEIYQHEPFYNRYRELKENRVKSKSRVKTHIVDTHNEIYRPQRFDEISTVVIRQIPSQIPLKNINEMTGLEFFGKIDNPHVQKILLINDDNQELAQQALEKGDIDDYLVDTDFNWLETFYQKLQESQWQYFNKLSKIFFEKVRPGHVNEYALNDPNFQKFFKTIIENYGFTEAYLCETTGSYLFLDEQAQDHGLVVNIGDQLDNWARTGQAKGINTPLLKELKDRKKMMCYHASVDGGEPDKSHWDIYAHPAKTIQGKGRSYYYAFAPNLYDIDVARILPFEEYRDQQRKIGRYH
ncbi:MAG: hypothetical protein FJX03_05400 [Alphaproteobacteria bacterium]|nr:hypothetical protein [Alphaproteobacteria bacterium]